MKVVVCFLFSIASVLCTTKTLAQNDTFSKVLKNNWAIQSSINTSEDGQTISKPGFNIKGWYATTMPSTILETLVNNKVVKNPYYGDNLVESKGFFSSSEYLSNMPKDSPYSVPWWFRTEFILPKGTDSDYLWLNLSSINYKANIWLNGHLIADTSTIEGAHRLYELDITQHAVRGGENCLSIEVFPPLEGTDLSIRWMQGSRTMPDKNTGIWYDVKVVKNGPLKLRHPQVITDLDLPDTSKAFIKIATEIKNQYDEDIQGILKGVIRPVNNLAEGGSSSGGQQTYAFEREISLKANSTEKFTASIEINDPQLWWPNGSGKQELYDLHLTTNPINQAISDQDNIRFGIREVSSYLEDFKHSENHLVRIFKINGKNIFIKGGNWTQTLMMEDDLKRNKAEIQHMLNLNFNTIRTEGFWGSDKFFDLCDTYGIMIFDGFNCCSIWERWDKWTDRTFEIAGKSLRDQVVRKRNHPAFIDWLLGSDNPPPLKVEKMYVDIIEKYDGTRPYQTNAMNTTTPLCGCSGLDHDPYPETYTYLPPSAWYGMKPKDENGNFGPYEFFEFNTEVGPAGEIIPQIESVRAMLPKEKLWPPNKSWEMRLSADSLSIPATEAFNKRYGQPLDLESYSLKAQVFQKESFRAMTEAFRKNKYKASGLLIYRLNAGWPSFSYFLYDFNLRGTGAYAGVQQGFEPLHILYTYDDQSVVVVNDLYNDFNNLKLTAQILNFDMTQKYWKTESLDIVSDEAKAVFKIPEIQGLSPIYFLNLELRDLEKNLVSSNFYWLTTQKDEVADFNELMKLPPVKLQISAKYQDKGVASKVTIKISNPSNHLAFFINPKLLNGLHGEELLPTYWSKTFLSIVPGGIAEITVNFNASDLNGNTPHISLDGWNIEPIEISLDSLNKEVTPILGYKNIDIPKIIKSGQEFDIKLSVTNTSTTGKALLKGQQYLFINNQSVSFKRIALGPGESKTLSWPSLKIHKPGKHTIKIGTMKPVTITVK